MPKPKKRSDSLFSLSARVRRREPVITYPDDEHGDDENCPICAAAREGRSISFDVLHAPEYLIAEARRVLERTPPGPGEEASISMTGRLMPDLSYDVVSYTVDSNGCIFKIRNGARSLVMQMPID